MKKKLLTKLKIGQIKQSVSDKRREVPFKEDSREEIIIAQHHA